MKKRLKIGPVALLVLLVLLTFLVVKRIDLPAEEAAGEAVRPVAKLWDTVVRHERAAAAVLALIALFAFVLWTALRAHKGEDKAMPPTQDSSASGTREPC